MQIDRLDLDLRARTPWEAIDLGFALLREHARAVALPWFGTGLLVLSALCALGFWLDLLALVPWVFWWLKPAFDRIPLFVLSRAVFGRVPAQRDVWRAAWVWGWRPVWTRLLWLRFDPFRAISMPSDLLEGLPGHERVVRRRLLRREGGAQVVTLWALLPLFEGLLYVSAFTLVGLLIPLEWWEARGGDWMKALFVDPDQAVQVGTAVVAGLAVLCIEPLFVAGGFGLYLCRRVHLEAWDIELGFKRMAQRAGSTLRSLALPLIALCLLGWGQALTPVMAATKDAAVPAHASKKIVGPTPLPNEFLQDNASERSRLLKGVNDTRSDPSLGGKTTKLQWQLKQAPERLPSQKLRSIEEWKEALGRWLGTVLGMAAEAVLWILALVALALLLWRFRDWLPWRASASRDAHEPPALRHRSLPVEDNAAADVLLQRARAAWTQGARREAMAWLYRAGLREVSARRPRPLPPGTTEGELLRAVRSLPAENTRRLVARLVVAWRAAAYAGREPDAATFDGLLRDWPAAFAPEPRP